MALSLKDKHANFIGALISADNALIAAFEDLRRLRREWDSLSLSTTLPDEDIPGNLAHVTVSDLAQVFFTVEALESVLDAGHAANLYKVKT